MAEELNIGNVYEMVDNGTWTLDKMAELGSVAYSDVNGDSKCDTGDKYGIGLGNVIHFDAYYTAAGLCTVTKDA